MGCSNAYYSMGENSNSSNNIRLPEDERLIQSSVNTQLNYTGVVSLGQFSKINEEINEIETLKLKGLSDTEIKLYLDYKKGQTYLEYVHKNMETSELIKTIHNILEKIGDPAEVSMTENDIYTNHPGTSNSSRHYSIDPNFQIKALTKTCSAVCESHPMNHLTELENDLFGHMDVDKIPPPNKRKKLARRMARKYAKDIPIPEPKPIIDAIAKKMTPHSYNDFIKQNPSNTVNYDSSLSRDVPERNPNSKWDIKEMKTIDKSNTNMLASISKLKRIGCSSNTLYTIQNRKIVRLEPKKIPDDSYKTSSDGIKSNFEIIDIKLPINKAEEQLLEGTKLSIDDIKMLPKFKNYEPGELSKTLFLKNIASAVTEIQLKDLFQGFDSKIDVKLMTGRMRGQAFITFKSSESAERALHQRNGTILKGKPIIIQFGKKGNG